MNSQNWNAENYEKYGRFVADRSMPLLELLGAQPGECILDLGCGDGVLTKKIADIGCKVTGLDLNPALVAAARKRGLHVLEGDASAMEFRDEFDAVFSSGALHWMKDADGVIRRVANALRASGRFVASMSGHDSMKPVQEALIGELNRRGHDGEAANPWYFPTTEEYSTRLIAAGFEVEHIFLDSRPTPLPGDLMGWLPALGGFFTAVLPQDERDDYLECVRKRIESHLGHADERTQVGAFGLSFKARLSAWC